MLCTLNGQRIRQKDEVHFKKCEDKLRNESIHKALEVEPRDKK